MREHYHQLYQSLLKDIDECKEKFPCLRKQVEHIFVICNQYWAIVCDDAVNNHFETKEEEIYFFKHSKPLFAAQLEYYSLYYHALLFKSEVYDPVKIRQFWIRESTRLDKFIAEHRDFYEYYKAGGSDKDVIYFTRGRNSLNTSVDGLDLNANTSHDSLVATLIALERYNGYVQNELVI